MNDHGDGIGQWYSQTLKRYTHVNEWIVKGANTMDNYVKVEGEIYFITRIDYATGSIVVIDETGEIQQYSTQEVPTFKTYEQAARS